MREKNPAAGPDRVKQEKQQDDVPAHLQQPKRGPSAQERQEDTGKTEAQDFFRQDESPVHSPRQDEQTRGKDEDASRQAG